MYNNIHSAVLDNVNNTVHNNKPNNVHLYICYSTHSASLRTASSILSSGIEE